MSRSMSASPRAAIPLAADPARSPFRIYRDVRFSKDKSPYKTNIGASFPHVERGPDGAILPSDVHGPGGYFHLSPGEIFVGGGMWHPEKDRLAAWRALVAGDPERVHAAVDDTEFVARFGSIGGDRLTRVPPGFPPDHPEAELLKLKDVTFGRRLADDEAFGPDLPDRPGRRPRRGRAGPEAALDSRRLTSPTSRRARPLLG